MLLLKTGEKIIVEARCAPGRRFFATAFAFGFAKGDRSAGYFNIFQLVNFHHFFTSILFSSWFLFFSRLASHPRNASPKKRPRRLALGSAQRPHLGCGLVKEQLGGCWRS